MVKGRLPSWRDTFRELNHAPFALGLLALLTALMGIAGLIAVAVSGRPSRAWWTSPWFLAAESAGMAALGIVCIVLYYKFRE